jgi:sigma-B regulation protein RsbU (phosphoserine phosphatase)
MVKPLSVKYKVLFALLGVALTTAITIGLIAVFLGISTLKEDAFSKLLILRELKANQIENYFDDISDKVQKYSGNDEIELTIRSLKNTYHKTHEVVLKNFPELPGFMSFYLVAANSGVVLSSVNGIIPNGAALVEKPYSDSAISRLYHSINATEESDITLQTDFSPYDSQVDTPSSFVGSPVFLDGNLSAIIIFQIGIEPVNKLMTGDYGRDSIVMGETGENYLVGQDLRMRNLSRLMPGYVKVGAQEEMALKSLKQGSGTIVDYRGVKALISYKHLEIRHLNWTIFSKIDEKETLKPIWLLLRRYLIYVFLLFLFIFSFSIIFADTFSKPVEALARANEQLKAQSAALKSAANGIIITDIHGIVKWVNPAFTKLTGYEFEEIAGKSLKILDSGIQPPEFFSNMWSKILNGEVWHDEVVNKRKDGSLYTEEMTITSVTDNDGKISQFVAIKHDITERKRLEQIVKSSHERMEGELNVAKDIQMSMLPLKFPAFPEREDIDVYARLIAAREVGGDFYDFFFIDEENFCFVVGDVSGKGVPAALFMAVTKVLIKASSHNEISTARILNHVNSEISRDNDNNMFITVFIGILNTTTGYLVYSNAGHNPPFILKKEGKLVKLPELHGLVIGAFQGIDYKETVVQLNRGDAFFAYTDGVTEAQNIQGKLYSEERLVRLLNDLAFEDCKVLVNRVEADVIAYEDGALQADDITLLSMHFKEQTADSVVDYLFTSITNRMENIAVLIGRFEEFAEKHSVPAEVLQKVNIVFDELLSNTISYAYQDNLAHEIEIKIRFYKEKLIITIMDDGAPYNPFDRTSPDITLGFEDREIGGLGIHLVKLLVDEYSYEYKKQVKKNITSFKKHI